MSFKTWKCPSCKQIFEDTDLVSDTNAKTGETCEECCPNCGTWLDTEDIINYE